MYPARQGAIFFYICKKSLIFLDFHLLFDLFPRSFSSVARRASKFYTVLPFYISYVRRIKIKEQ